MNRRSLVIVAVAAALVLIATSIRSGWLYLVASFLLALVVAGILSGWRSVRRVELERECPAEVFEGDPFTVRIRVKNAGRLARYLITMKDLQFGGRRAGRPLLMEGMRRRRERLSELARGRGGPEKDAGGYERVPATRTVCIEKLGGGCGTELSYTLSAPRRGVHRFARMSLSCGGILGAGEMKKKLTVPSPVTVFPRSDWLAHFPLDPFPSATPVESYEWTRKGMGEDYYGTREYVRGDSLKHVHWKSTARQGRLIVREYQQELRPWGGLVVVLDRPMHGDRDVNSLEDGLRAASTIIGYFAKTGSQPQLVVPSAGGLEAVGGGTLAGCMTGLASYEPPARLTSETDIVGALRYAGDMFPPGCAITLIANAPADAVAGALARGGVAPLAVVLALDDSYGYRWTWDDAGAGLLRLSMAAHASGADLFVVRSGREINRCLTEPYVTTGS